MEGRNGCSFCSGSKLLAVARKLGILLMRSMGSLGRAASSFLGSPYNTVSRTGLSINRLGNSRRNGLW